MESVNYNLSLTHGWMFHLGDAKRFDALNHAACYSASKAGGALGDLSVFRQQNEWQPVAMPHDWMTRLPVDPDSDPSGGYKPRGVGWYYVAFRLTDAPVERARLVLDGVLGQATVYVNGTIAARNFSGYNRFACEIGDLLVPGAENIIAVYVDARTWEGWWYEGAGIYRPVTVEFRRYARFDREKCFLRGETRDGKWYAAADLSSEGENLSVTARLLDADGREIARTVCPADAPIRLPAENPMLWTPETPYTYALVCTLFQGETPVDSVHAAIGFRTVEWTAASGMLLNGRPYPVKGICCHQDHAGVGAAVPPEVIEYRIRRLKELGINAYRCAHHAPSEALLEVCDRLGMLVMAENRHFSVSEDALRQLDAMVALCRNHPCVFLYSLFNEEPWQKETRGLRMARVMRARVRALDATRAVTAAMNGGVLTGENASDALDVIGINYYLADYEACHLRAPDKCLLGTENCPTFATRGEYAADADRPVYNSYGDEWASFSESMEQTMEFMMSAPYAAGCFAWSGFDYRGEPQPHEWPSVMSHWGVTDLCGFPKDTAYLLAAWYKCELTVHLLPHWNHAAGEMVRVCAFTNADTARLFLNGRCLGEKRVTRCRAEWQVEYAPGKLRVEVFKGGQTATDEVSTAGMPARLALEDATPMGGGARAHIINIRATDQYGVLLPDFDGVVTIDAPEGAILGVGNGDPNGHEMETAARVRLFHGLAQLITVGGKLSVTARCEGLQERTIEVRDL